MRLSYKKLLAIVYADIFDYPLTRKELNLFAIEDIHAVPAGRQGLATDQHRSKTAVETKQGYFFLRGREKLVALREKREKLSQVKLEKARLVVGSLNKILFIEAIFLTGSVAIGNAPASSDIDLMIVTKPHTLWLTRLLVVGMLKVKGLYRRPQKVVDRVCTNIFLDTDHLAVIDKNLYSAHEMLQAKCIFDRGGVEKQWLESNSWVRQYLPNAYESQKLKVKNQKSKSKVESFILLPFELSVFCLQYLYMRSRITSEKIGLGYAYFHPNNLAIIVERLFKNRIRSAGIITR